MKGNGFDVDSPASSDVYLGKARATQGPFKKADPGAPRLPIQGGKVGVDYERYMVKVRSLPTGDTRLAMRSRLHGIRQKKRGVVTEEECELFDPATGLVYYRFINAGFLIGGRGVRDAGHSNAVNISPPDRSPDHEVELQVATTAHLIYRLCGDYNPLHVDPASPMVKGGGFTEPILMGLCTLGYASRAVLDTCAGGDPSRFHALKLRFASPVLPGQTLVTSMWHIGQGDNGSQRVVFVCKVKETGKTVVSNAYMELTATPSAKL